MNVAEALKDIAQKFSDKPALIFKDTTITFSQLRGDAFRLADSLRRLGVEKGSAVALYLPNCPEGVYSYAAIWSIGAVAVPLDFMLTEEEIVSCVVHSEAAVLIVQGKPAVSLESIKARCPQLKEIICCGRGPSDFRLFDDVLKAGKEDFPKVDISHEDYAAIFYTSGTTGRPKGVLTNYRQLEASPQSMAHFVGLGADDIALCALPISHLGGLVFVHAILFLATTVVMMDRFIPQEFLRNVQQYKVTCFWLVPPMYYAILQLKEFEVFDLSSLHWINVFGAPSSPEQIKRFHQYCPHAVLYHGWGMTETQGPTVVTPEGSEKIASVGVASPFVEIKIFDNDNREVARGDIGELVIRGWPVSDGYYKDPEATQEAWRGGWFHTGDLARFDDEGFLYIVGRKKEMIKVGGEIVFEPEVEATLFKHPAVAEAAVVGVSDKLRGEVPKAFVVVREGQRLVEEELRLFCRQHLAHFKIPRYFDFVPALPRNRAGKIDKETLRRPMTSL